MALCSFEDYMLFIKWLEIQDEKDHMIILTRVEVGKEKCSLHHDRLLSGSIRGCKGGREGGQSERERCQLTGGRWRKEERRKTSVRSPQTYPQVWWFTERIHRTLKTCYTHGYVCYGKRMQIKVSKGKRCCGDQAQGSQLSSPSGV